MAHRWKNIYSKLKIVAQDAKFRDVCVRSGYNLITFRSIHKAGLPPTEYPAFKA